MYKWGMALAALVLLGVAAESHAQVRPTNGNGLTFVPVDTTSNLVAPLPVYGAAQPKGSFFDRFYNALASIVPFMTPRQSPPVGSRNHAMGQLPAPKQPTSTLPNLPSIPQIPPIVSGTLK